MAGGDHLGQRPVVGLQGLAAGAVLLVQLAQHYTQLDHRVDRRRQRGFELVQPVGHVDQVVALELVVDVGVSSCQSSKAFRSRPPAPGCRGVRHALPALDHRRSELIHDTEAVLASSEVDRSVDAQQAIPATIPPMIGSPAPRPAISPDPGDLGALGIGGHLRGGDLEPALGDRDVGRGLLGGGGRRSSVGLGDARVDTELLSVDLRRLRFGLDRVPGGHGHPLGGGGGAGQELRALGSGVGLGPGGLGGLERQVSLR